MPATVNFRILIPESLNPLFPVPEPMKIIVTLEISPETAAEEEITPESLQAFAEELRQDAARTLPRVSVTVEALP